MRLPLSSSLVRSLSHARAHLLGVAAIALTTSAFAAGCATEGNDVPLYPVPYRAADGRLQVYDGSNFVPLFIKGMNFGIAVPGTQPGDLAATDEDYDRWFDMLREIGINTIRLYTLHYPRFYKRFHAWNMRHLDNPLYAFHGIWLDEENPTNNLRDMQSHYEDNIVETIECVHGNRFIFERKGRGHGEYDTDISPWVIGWLVGREVFPSEVTTTNKITGARAKYEGAYVSIFNATESEAWWAERIDQIAAYEATHYGKFRPISMSSWPTLDPLYHVSDGGVGEDDEQIDLAKLDTSRFPGGYFASYHAYPYYPDWMNEDPDYVTKGRDYAGPNSYFEYLKVLRAHYYPKPLVIAEVGVPSSWGNAHYATSGMSHGGQDEIKQGHDDVRLFRNAYDSGTGGAILFNWIDEWWKRTWLVDELAMPRERYKLWHNVTSPEQNFGLIGFDLDPPDFAMFEPARGAARITEVRGAADAKFFHVKISLASALADGETLTVGYDTYRDDLGELVLPDGKRTSQRSELAVTIKAPNDARLLVTEAYDQFSVWHDTQNTSFGEGKPGLPAGRPYHSIPSDGGKWNLVRWKNNMEHYNRDGSMTFPESIQDIGILAVRTASQEETGLSAVVFDGTTVTVRIPWTLLHVTDPSELRVLHDDPKTRERETVLTDGFRVAVSLGGDLVETTRMKWQRWDEAPKWHERRKLSYAIFAEGIRAIPDR